MADSWSSAAPAGTKPWPRSHFSATEVNDKVYVFGGKDFNGAETENELYILNLSGLKAWNLPKTTGVAPTKRHSHSSIVLDKKIWVFGGYGGKYLNDLYLLNCGK